MQLAMAKSNLGNFPVLILVLLEPGLGLAKPASSVSVRFLRHEIEKGPRAVKIKIHQNDQNKTDSG